jgi:hypothetical protein
MQAGLVVATWARFSVTATPGRTNPLKGNYMGR